MELDTPVIDRLKQMELDLPPLYQLLNHDRQEIRLLRILPPQPDCKDICCLLEVASLSTYLFYRALSYEWGPPDDKDQVPATRVFLNSHFVTTTPNLRLALAHLLNEQAWFWIDALCINQSDDDERARQVSMMTRIYEQAFGVDVWLGLEEGSSGQGMRFIGAATLALENPDPETDASKWRVDWMKAALMNPDYESTWDGLSQIITRGYWKRIWIIQELVANPLSERVYLRCGQDTASFQRLLQLLGQINILSQKTRVELLSPWVKLLFTLDGSSTKIQRIGHHARNLARERREKVVTKSNIRFTLLPLLAEYYQQQCSDPRDKVYALLGISCPYDGPKLDISYSISVEQLFLDVAIHIINGAKRLDLLLCCRRISSVTIERPISTLPSWVPDWRYLDRANRIVRPRREKWQASGPSSTIKVSYSSSCQVLNVSGWLIGLISRCQHLYECVIPREGDELVPSIKKLMRILLDFTAKTVQVPDKEGLTLVPMEDTIQLLHNTTYEPRYGVAHARHKYHGTKFSALCASLYPSPDPNSDHGPDVDSKVDNNPATFTAQDWATEVGLELLMCNDYNRRLCAITMSTNYIPGVKPEYARIKTIGLSSRRAQTGDMVVVVEGCKHPVVLRPVDETGLYQLIDECFVYDFMNGEALQMFPEVELRIK